MNLQSSHCFPTIFYWDWHFAVTSNDDLRFKCGRDGHYAKLISSVRTQQIRETLLGFKNTNRILKIFSSKFLHNHSIIQSLNKWSEQYLEK
jgi:hypothetical protein